MLSFLKRVSDVGKDEEVSKKRSENIPLQTTIINGTLATEDDLDSNSEKTQKRLLGKSTIKLDVLGP